MQWLATREIATLEEVRQVLENEGYPYSAHPEERFDNWTIREDLATAGDLEGAVRIMRFVQVSDMQLIDDDAVTLRCSRQEVDQGFGSAGLGLDGCWRPQEEYGDEILHSVVDVLNEHHKLDRFDFAIHTGDNIDNALENELIRYIDIIEGTHTTVGPLSGYECVADGQSTSVDDDQNDVVNQCTSIPEHLVPELRGIADDFVWYSAYGNHDGLIQGNLAITDKERAAANAVGRMFIQETEYVAMHFADLDLCAGGSEADDFGHGFGLAPEENRCDDNPDNDGYYAFDHQGVRMIVLDTVHDDLAESNENTGGNTGSVQTGASGLAPGGIDAGQFAWLAGELEAATGPVFIFGHHTVTSFWNGYFDENQGTCYESECLDDAATQGGVVGRDQLMGLLAEHPNVITFFGGHTHFNRITTQHPGGEHPGFWNVETSGLLDLPQETRIVELWRTADGEKLFWAMDPVGHLFDLARELAKQDEQVDAEYAKGEAKDRQVILWMDAGNFTLPDGAQPPLYLPDTITVSMVEPLAANDGSALVPDLGEHPITVRVEGPDGPLRGVTAHFGVTKIDQPEDAEPVAVTQVFTPMTSTSFGTFTTTYNFEYNGMYTVGINLIDRDGEDLGTEYFDIETGSGLEVNDQGASLVALPFLLAGIALALFGARRT